MSEHHTDDGLLRYVERIEAMQIARQTANEGMRGIYAEAKEAGLVPALLRQIVRERQLDADVRADQYATLNDYRETLGLFADTPLGEAAVRAENVTRMPRPFAEQAVHQERRRGRPRKRSAIEAAEELLGA
jgi:uncharacterized protein (UPF0335 family)